MDDYYILIEVKIKSTSIEKVWDTGENIVRLLDSINKNNKNILTKHGVKRISVSHCDEDEMEDEMEN